MQTSLFAFLLLATPLSAVARQNDEATRPMIRRRAQGISQPNPDVCQNFAVYAGGALAFAATNTIESGDVGAFGAISGVSTLSDGDIVKDTSAFADDTAALHAQLMAVRPDGLELIEGDLGGRTFTPGNYRADSAITIVSNVILDGGGDPNSLFLFQVLSMATTAGTSIILTNGAKAENVVWVISAATAHGPPASFKAPFWPEAPSHSEQGLLCTVVPSPELPFYSGLGYLLSPPYQSHNSPLLQLLLPFRVPVPVRHPLTPLLTRSPGECVRTSLSTPEPPSLSLLATLSRAEMWVPALLSVGQLLF